MTVHQTIAAPTIRAIPSLSAVEAGGQASPIPTWANCAQGRTLLTAIRAERPHVIVYDDGLSAWNGRQYAGKNAAQLRALFARTFDMMLQDAEQQHDALVDWRKANNAEVVIGRLLGDRS